ncbi:hypothetical protein RCCS2_10705 [Roseobacter sp. CCS2]|nr:hypothetical protein RCCS2_10705 [Roseobacter sp. CCS2]
MRDGGSKDRGGGLAVKASDIVLTLPQQEAELLRKTYGSGSYILEYGSGGSTLEALKLGRHVTAVESDPDWAKGLDDALGSLGYQGRYEIIPVDIGKVGKWGKPRDGSGFESYHRYALSVWDHPSFVNPDVVLIDGRFRVACFCAVVMRTVKPVRVLIDDYQSRDSYHVVERIIKPTQIVGRMAVFDVPPDLNIREHLTWAIGSFVVPA